jgi:alpha-aminoadipic semialdehyde synthase
MPDNPVFIYNPVTDEIIDGFKGEGFAVCAIDNLPCEFSKEASDFFSSALEPFVEAMLENDYLQPIAESTLPEEIKKACIVHKGRLEEDFDYLEMYLNK